MREPEDVPSERDAVAGLLDRLDDPALALVAGGADGRRQRVLRLLRLVEELREQGPGVRIVSQRRPPDEVWSSPR